MKLHILITDHVHTCLIDGLNKIALVTYEPDITYDRVKEIISDYQGLIVNSKIRVDEQFLENAKGLIFIGRLGSGLDIFDLQAAKERGVHIINSPEGNANAVGEHALALLLALLNKIPKGHQMVKSLRPWDRESVRGLELDGLSVGIIGVGHTGTAFAKKLRGFDVKLHVHDKYKKRIPRIHRFQEESTRQKLLATCDIVSLHLPLTAETNQLVNDDFIDRMKTGSILINTSRGAIVNLESVLRGLDQGKLKGVCLDVFENEKPKKYTKSDLETMQKLVALPQVVLSPHVAGWTLNSKRKIAETLLKKIIYVADY